jgi:hypothetical protein
MATYILASGTIDEEIYDLIASKRTIDHSIESILVP